MTGPVRVAICEDSRTYAEGLRHFLEADGRLKVVAMARSAEGLVDDLARVRPDLVTMDLELPGLDGVRAIERIMATRPVPIVVVSAHSGPNESFVTAAMAAGALDSVPKSEVRLDLRAEPAAIALRRRLVGLARGARPTARRPVKPVGPPVPPANGRMPRAGVATAVGIGASAGGPQALGEVLALLPETLAMPVLVVQHMSDGFMGEFVAWLDSVVAPPVRLARNGEPPGPGVTIAPDGAHMLVGQGGRVRLDARSEAGSHRPSVDALLSSLADTAGRGAVAVILTGMGRDGATGVTAVRAAGGVALAESSDQALLSGMPAAAAAAGATPLSLVEIAHVLTTIAGRVAT
jgi:two-component system, chemotaxis family, protein-glutamate methylesterase/glutaminase